MKMRAYYDAQHGDGSWDRMLDLIKQKQIFGWVQPVVEVDGHTVHFFPGEDREVTVDQVRDELRRVFAQVEKE